MNGRKTNPRFVVCESISERKILKTCSGISYLLGSNFFTLSAMSDFLFVKKKKKTVTVMKVDVIKLKNESKRKC